MTTQTKAKARKRGRELPDEACPTCGTIMRSVRGKLSASVHGEKVAVPDMPHLRCPKCGEGLFSLAVARELERRGIDLHRAKYGLLSADAGQPRVPARTCGLTTGKDSQQPSQHGVQGKKKPLRGSRSVGSRFRSMLSGLESA